MNISWLRHPPSPPPRRAASRRLPPAAPQRPADDRAEPPPGCGWFESSWELRQGLKVIEYVDLERLPPEVPLAWLLQ